MKLIRISHSGQKYPEAVVATIGNFDGVHRGHQRIIDRAKTIAKKAKLPTMIVVFEPQPGEYFSKESPPPRLTSLREKITIFNCLGIDYVAILPFKRIASLPAFDFVKRILCDRFHIRDLVVGDDFRFGKGRIGDFSFLVRIGKQLNFSVESMPTMTLQNAGPCQNGSLRDRISSSWIRELLNKGDFRLAERLLGRQYTVCGRVIHGKKLGRQLKIPTANIDIRGRILPLQGVFVVDVLGLDTGPIRGVASVGYNPTVNTSRFTSPLSLEVHLLEYGANIYGRFIEIAFLYRLRDEKKFDSLEDLRQQILADVQAAKLIK